MPVRMPSIEEILNAWKENPRALFIGAVCGFTAGCLLTWYAVSSVAGQAGFMREQAVAEAKAAGAQRDDLKNRLDEAEKQIRQASSKTNALIEQLSQRDASIVAFEDDTKTLLKDKDEALQSVSRKGEAQKAALAELQKKHDALTVRLKQLGGTSDRSRLTAAQDDVTRLSTKVRTLEVENSRLRRAAETPTRQVSGGVSAAREDVLVAFFKQNDCAYVAHMESNFNIEDGLIEYHASRLVKEGLVVACEYSHQFGITDKGRAYVVENRLISR